jgi:hypothetical protein
MERYIATIILEIYAIDNSVADSKVDDILEGGLIHNDKYAKLLKVKVDKKENMNDQVPKM